MDRTAAILPDFFGLPAVMMQMRPNDWRGSTLATLTLALLPTLAMAQDKPAEAWPTTVQAQYRLKYNGIDVGQLDVTSNAAGKSYSVTGSSKVSVLFGAVTWTASSSVSGTIDGGTPVPAIYAFDWKNKKKAGAIKMRFKDRTAAQVDVTPPPEPHPDVVPLTAAHRAGALDPVSAVLMLTKADGRPPCDRRVSIFDGKNRYDIVLTYKLMTRIAPAKTGGASETAYVCRAMYQPIAGHRDNDSTKTYASNRDVEVVMRRVPGSELLIPYSVTIPTAWGTGSMVTERIDVTTASVGKFAMTR